jgi:phosphonate transport system substrate-binding protein
MRAIKGESKMKLTRRSFLMTSAAAGAAIAAPNISRSQSSTLRVGLIPSEDSRAMLAASDQLLKSLEDNLGQKVQGFVASDYNGVIEAMRSNHVEVAYLGPFSYVLGTTVAPIEAFCTAETSKSGRTYYHSQIIAKKSSGIKTLDDLKGKNFAFVDPASTSGYAFPLAGLLKAGIEPKRDFKTVIFTGAHDANAVAVANGKVDAATIADRILDAAIAKGHIKADEIEIVWRSAPIPESPMVWRKDLSPELKAKVKAAFLAIKDLNWSDQGKLNGFKDTNDQAYDVVRETAKLANIDLKKQK